MINKKNKGLKERSVAEYDKIFFAIQSNFTRVAFINTLQKLNLYNEKTKTLCKMIQSDTHIALISACKHFIKKEKSYMEMLYKNNHRENRKIPDSFLGSHNFSVGKNILEQKLGKKLTDFFENDWQKKVPFEIPNFREKISENDKTKAKEIFKTKAAAINFAVSNYIMQKMGREYLKSIAAKKNNLNKIKITNTNETTRLTGLILEIEKEIEKETEKETKKETEKETEKETYKFRLHASEFNKYRHIIDRIDAIVKFFKKDKNPIYLKDDLKTMDNDINKYFNEWLEKITAIEIKIIDAMSDNEKNQLINADGYIDFKSIINNDTKIILDKQDKEISKNIRNMIFHHDTTGMKLDEVINFFKKYNFTKKNAQKHKKLDNKR